MAGRFRNPEPARTPLFSSCQITWFVLLTILKIDLLKTIRSMLHTQTRKRGLHRLYLVTLILRTILWLVGEMWF